MLGTTMSSRTWVVGLLGMALAMPLAGRDKTDVIILNNGDRLTGEIKSLSSGVLYVSLDYVDGTIAVGWSKVVELKSTQLFLVRTAKGDAHTGTLRGSAAPGGPVVIEVAEDKGGKVDLPSSSIVELDETSPKFLERFSGEIDASALQSKGNDSVQFSGASQIDYRRQRWAILSNINSNITASSGDTPSSRNQLRLTGFHYIGTGNWFYAGVGNALQSTVQRIAIQGNVGAGIGVFLRNSNSVRFSVIGGLAWQATDYNVPNIFATQKVVAGLAVVDLNVFKFKKTSLSFTTSVFPAISNPDRGRIYCDTNAAYAVKIATNFWWTLSFYGSWDTRPPPHLSGSDYGSSLGLSWKFGGR